MKTSNNLNEPTEVCPTCGYMRCEIKPQVTLDQLPERGYVRQKLLNQLIPFSPATLWRKVGKGEFPKPHKLSDRVTAWRIDDVKQWFAERDSASD
jgi:prophage regulatory protein